MKYILFALMMCSSLNMLSQKVTIAAASSLHYLFNDVKALYSKSNPNVIIEVTSGASGTFYNQILNGAKFDLFFAADTEYPQKLKDNGMVHGDVKVYAHGSLVLWSNNVDVSKGLSILNSPKVMNIAIGKTATVPYGKSAVDCLKRIKQFDQLKHKFVYAESVSQATQYVQTGNAEVAFTALSIALVPQLKGNYFIIPQSLYEPIKQGVVQLKNDKPSIEATKFLNFMTSKACHEIFIKYGFIIP